MRDRPQLVELVKLQKFGTGERGFLGEGGDESQV